MSERFWPYGVPRMGAGLESKPRWSDAEGQPLNCAAALLDALEWLEFTDKQLELPYEMRFGLRATIGALACEAGALRTGSTALRCRVGDPGRALIDSISGKRRAIG